MQQSPKQGQNRPKQYNILIIVYSYSDFSILFFRQYWQQFMLPSNSCAQITTTATSTLQQCTSDCGSNEQLKQLEKQRSPECLINELYEKTQKFWKLEVKQDDIKSLAICYLPTVQSEADRNNPKACFLRGRCYDLGFGLQKDKHKAKEWYEIARKFGQIHSIYNLYDNQKNKLIKMQLQEEGLAKGEIRFLYNKARKILAEKVHTQVGNLNEAISIMQQLMRQNDNYAHYLGWLMKSQSQKYSRQEAENHLKMYYEKLRPKRKYDLFLAFQLMDLELYSQAISLFQHIYYTCPPSVSLQQGNIQYSIGFCYRKLQKMEQAKFWQKKAISKNLVKSFVNLANIYANEGQSELEKQLLHKAIKLGKGLKEQQNLSTAFHNLGACYDESEQFEKQFQCYNQAIKLGHLNCVAMNGYMLYYGMGVKVDKIKGMDLIEAASKEGSQKGQQLISKIKAREAQNK